MAKRKPEDAPDELAPELEAKEPDPAGGPQRLEGPFAALPVRDGLVYVAKAHVTDLHQCADGTHVHLANGRCYTLSLPLDEAAALLG